jgi:hypothetical protein
MKNILFGNLPSIAFTLLVQATVSIAKGQDLVEQHPSQSKGTVASLLMCIDIAPTKDTTCALLMRR